MMRILLAIALCSSSAIWSQMSLQVDRYREDFPNAHSIQLVQEKVIKLDLEGDEIKIVEEYHEEDLYLNENATQASKASLSFSSFFQLLDIEAYTLVPDNDKYQKFKVEEYREKDELNESFHDDLKSINFVYPNLNPGGRTVLKYSREVKNPRFLNPFYFGNTYPIAKNKLTIIADKSIRLQFREINMENLPVSYKETEKRGKVIYTWETGNINEFEFESGSPTFRSVLPHIIPIVVSYTIEEKEVKVLENISDLYNWYYSLIKDVNDEDANESMKILVSQLIQGQKSDLDKVRAIYYWVQDQIKYIDFEAGLGGFIPRKANDVLEKKYGDCKDNSSLLYKMLQVAGLKGNITWIGTRRIPYTYDEVPTPLVDDHMILTYFDGDTPYFLDATGRYTSLELPTSFIQGKEALISYGENQYRLEKVPVSSANLNRHQDVTHLELDGDILKGTCKTELSGYKKIDFFYELEEKNSKKDIYNWYQTNFQKGNNTFMIEKLSETNKYSYDKNLQVDYDFQIANYIKSYGDEIYFNLNLNRDLLKFKTITKRVTPIEIEYKESYVFTNILKIPEGYKVDYLPENVEVQNDLFKSSINYTIKGNEVHYLHQISVDTLLIDIPGQERMNNLIEEIEKAYNEVIVLKKF